MAPENPSPAPAQPPVTPPPAAEPPRDPSRAADLDWNRRAAIGVLFGAAVLLVGGILWWRFGPPNGHANDQHKLPPSTDDVHAGTLFESWGKPELVVVVSGQMFGYLQPCGCSWPQKGGLARRYNLIQSLRDRGWQVVAVDVGDVAAAHGAPHDQLVLKYATAMKSLDLLRYTAVGVGKTEFGMPLFEALSYSLNNPTPPFVAANMRDIASKYPGVLHASVVNEKSSPRVGVVGLIAKSRRDELTKEGHPDANFADDTIEVLKKALKNLSDKKVEFGILLLQGRERDLRIDPKLDPALEDAKLCADMTAEWRKKDPTLAPLNLIVRNSGPDLSDPPAIATRAGGSAIISVGHKGKHVGVVGVFRKGAGYMLKYQLVSIGPEWDTPQGKEHNNPVTAKLEEYTKEVKRRDFMAQFGRSTHPVKFHFDNARYVGSERCGDCHEHAYDIWKKKWNGHSHSHAYDTLVKVRHPSLRQFDGECIVCHTTGFEHRTGYYDPENFPDNPQAAAKNDVKLRHVGCESCHGPGSEHIRIEQSFKPNNPAHVEARAKMYQLMNPFKATAEELDAKTPPARKAELNEIRMRKIDFSCQKCHDQENDLHWNFNVKWPKIIHMTPRPETGKAAQADKAQK